MSEQMLGKSRRSTFLAAAAGTTVGSPFLYDAAQRGSVTALDLLWNVIASYWRRITPFQYFPGCLGSSETIECLGYLHTYPIVLGPLAGLPLHQALMIWALINVVLVFGITSALSVGYGLRPALAFVFSAVFASSGSVGNVISNGQTSLLVLLLIVALPLLIGSPVVAGVVAGLGMFKVSLFVPVLGIFIFSRPKVAAYALGTLMTSAVWSVVWLPRPAKETLLGPLIIASALNDAGYAQRADGDIPRLLADYGIQIGSIGSVFLATAGTVVAVSAYIMSQHLATGLAAGGIVALVFFPHFPYDYVFAAPALALGLSKLPRPLGALLAASASLLVLRPNRLLVLFERALGVRVAFIHEAFTWPMEAFAARTILFTNLLTLLIVLQFARTCSGSHESSQSSLLR